MSADPAARAWQGALAALVLCLLPSGSPLGADGSSAGLEVCRLAARGRWILDRAGDPTPPRGITRGLQPSGLAFRGGELWSIGDQRSAYPGHIFRIDPRTARLLSDPVRIEAREEDAERDQEIRAYRAIPNSDFEALCVDPKDPAILFAVTEDKIPWIAEIHVEAAPAPEAKLSAAIRRLVRIPFPEDLESWRGDPNFRFEGAAVSDDGEALYLAFERARDGFPRIYRLRAGSLRGEGSPSLEEIRVPFGLVPRREEKPEALLNVNDIQFVRADGRDLLLAVLRDQERLLAIDIELCEILRVVDLDLLDPSGRAIEWVSPEGLAADAASDRLWLVNDPDSMRSNYRLRSAPLADGPFAEFTPLLFEFALSDVLPVAGRQRPRKRLAAAARAARAARHAQQAPGGAVWARSGFSSSRIAPATRSASSRTPVGSRPAAVNVTT
ncbi:MAG: hypothetical protein ACUVYA_13325 [Planctomycetota bacterium]